MNADDERNNDNFDEATSMQKKFSFSALAKRIGVPLADIRNAIIVERIVTPQRVTMAGEPVSFEFGDLYVGDKVTEEGVILATINLGGDIRRPNWTTIEAGQFFVSEADVERVRAHFISTDATEQDAVQAPPNEPAETPKERRARLLSWLEEEEKVGGERGALTRVTDREKKRRPTADRANIGKAIKTARTERIESNRAGAWFGPPGK